MTIIENVPQSLRKIPQWVVWRNDDGRKMPYNPRTGRQAQSNNSMTWTSFDEAVKAYQSGNYTGLGFVFTKDTGLVGIDLDDCIDSRGNIAEWADYIVSNFGTYAEVSPSGTGIKLWAEGEIPSNIGHTEYETGAIEMYNNVRFFTVTGNYVRMADSDTPQPIRYVNGALTELHSKVLEKKNGNRIEYKAPVTTTAPVKIEDKRISAYVDRAFHDEIAAVALAPDGHKHETLRNAAVKLATLFTHGLDENTAFDALYNAIAGRARNANEAANTIRDGFNFGRDKPRDLTHLSTVSTQCQPVNSVSTPVSTTELTSQPSVNPQEYKRLWYTEDELQQIRLPRYIVDGVIVFGETTVVFGPSDAGKTFIVVDMVMRAAQHYPVMYVAGEDMPGVRLRKIAWQQHYKRQTNGNFRMWHGEFSLFDSEQVDTFIMQNRAANSKLIVFDTLSQCSIGADENSNTAMAMVMANCNRIAHEVGAAVIVIHHTTKQETSYRGAAAIKGNTYGFLSVEKQDEAIKLECVRIKNSPAFPDRYFRLVDVVVDGMVDSRGNPVGSCVIRPSKQVIKSDKLSKVQCKVLETIGIITKAQGKASAADAMNSLELKGNSFYKPLNVLLDKQYVARLTTKQGNSSGYAITENGRQYLISVANSTNPVTSDDDIITELFTINPIDLEVDTGLTLVDSGVKELTQGLTLQKSGVVDTRLTQVDEPSQFRDIAGY